MQARRNDMLDEDARETGGAAACAPVTNEEAAEAVCTFRARTKKGFSRARISAWLSISSRGASGASKKSTRARPPSPNSATTTASPACVKPIAGQWPRARAPGFISP
jgi:hypothetical protein